MKWYKDKLIDCYMSKNKLWIIQEEKGSYIVYLKANSKAYKEIASYSFVVCGGNKNALEKCKQFVENICHEAIEQ